MNDKNKRRFVVMHGPKQDIRTELLAACCEATEGGTLVFYRSLDASLKDIFFVVKDFGYMWEDES